jgi:hypothetical protein
VTLIVHEKKMSWKSFDYDVHAISLRKSGPGCYQHLNYEVLKCPASDKTPVLRDVAKHKTPMKPHDPYRQTITSIWAKRTISTIVCLNGRESSRWPATPEENDASIFITRRFGYCGNERFLVLFRHIQLGHLERSREKFLLALT